MIRWMAALGAAGCAGGAEQTCIDANPASAEADFTSDLWHIGCDAPPTGTAPPCAAPTRAEIEAQCADAGAPCDGAITVGRDAAVCIAQSDGLAAGIEGPYADLMFHDTYDRPVWSVSSVETEHSGHSYTIDAGTGEILATSEWNAIP